MSTDRFDPSQYYQIHRDHDLREENENVAYVSLTRLGGETVAKYYHWKYATDISFSEEHISDSDAEFSSMLVADLHDKIAEKKMSENESRSAYIYVHMGHFFPIIYLKEDKKEGFFIFDSRGKSGDLEDIAAEIAKKFKQPVYIVDEVRQADKYSCMVDSLIVSINATGIDKDTNIYLVPHLLSFLEKHSYKPLFDERVHSVKKIPDRLLMSAQLNDFITTYQLKETQAPVHQRFDDEKKVVASESLAQHRARHVKPKMQKKIWYQDKEGVDRTAWVTKDIHGYLLLKGFKFADLIEIQVQLDYLKDQLKGQWSDRITKLFFRYAKDELKRQGKLHWSTMRVGLDEFTNKFLKVISTQELKRIEDMFKRSKQIKEPQVVEMDKPHKKLRDH